VVEFAIESFTMKELTAAWGYARLVLGQWWVITIEVILVSVDVVERMLGTWLLPPLRVKVTIGILVLVFAQYRVYRAQQEVLLAGAARKERLTRLAECMRVGRQFFYRPSSQIGWVKWASDVDDWMTKTFKILQTEFGTLAVEKFVNDAALNDAEYPGVPAEFQQRMLILNRRLENLDAIAQRSDTYLLAGG
jgi:hypothetical protein